MLQVTPHVSLSGVVVRLLPRGLECKSIHLALQTKINLSPNGLLARCASATRKLDRAPQCGHSRFLSRKAVVVNDQPAAHVERGDEQTGCDDIQHRGLWKVSRRAHISRFMASSTCVFCCTMCVS